MSWADLLIGLFSSHWMRYHLHGIWILKPTLPTLIFIRAEPLCVREQIFRDVLSPHWPELGNTSEHTIFAHKWNLGSFRASVLCIKVPKSPPSGAAVCMGLFRHHSSTLVCVTPQLLEGFASAAVSSQLAETRAGQVLLLPFILSRGAWSHTLYSFFLTESSFRPSWDSCCKNVTASWCHWVAPIVVTRNQRSEETRLVQFCMLSRYRAWRTVVE